MARELSAGLRVGIRCDAGPGTGVGHLVRCVALAEELVARGHAVRFLADLGGVAFAERQLAARALPCEAPPADGAQFVATAADFDAVVIDSYALAPSVSRALVDAGVPVLAFVDGSLRGVRAHLYVDQNIGAEHDHVPLPDGARRLAGTRYAVLRDAVRRLRPPAPWARSRQQGPPRVVVAYGGTDAFGLTETTVRALVDAAAPFAATVISPDPAVRARLSALSVPGASVEAIAPSDDFPARLAAADLVIGAAGTSAWEYCCLGRPAAAAAVVDNQHQAYGRLVAAGAVIGLGRLDEALGSPAVFADRVRGALVDAAARAAAASVAFGLVDGDGRVRVVDELEALVNVGGAPRR